MDALELYRISRVRVQIFLFFRHRLFQVEAPKLKRAKNLFEDEDTVEDEDVAEGGN
jgi:hypothetical protein